MEGESPALPGLGRAGLVKAAVCAAVCVLFWRAGFLSLFFLVPPGFAAAAFGGPVAWAALVIAGLGSLAVAGLSAPGGGFGGAGLDLLYFGVLGTGFTWVMAGNPPGLRLAAPRTFFRFAAASAVAALVVMGTVRLMPPGEFFAMLEPLVSAYVEGVSAGDEARRAALEQTLTAERLGGAVSSIIFRGGALFSAALLLFFSRKLAFGVARLFRRGRRAPGDLRGFFAPKSALLVLSLSLPAVLLARALALPVTEVAAWNLLVICVIAFVAQGGGVVLFNLALRPLPVVARVLLGVVFAVALLSPGVNIVVLGALMLLGIAENWLPLRRADARAVGGKSP